MFERSQAGSENRTVRKRLVKTGNRQGGGAVGPSVRPPARLVDPPDPHAEELPDGARGVGVALVRGVLVVLHLADTADTEEREKTTVTAAVQSE